MLVSDIAMRVKRQFGDEAGVQITDSDILRWINDAQKEICSKSNILEATASVTTVAGTNTFDLPSDLQDLLTVMYNGTMIQGLSMREAEESIQKVGDPTSQLSGEPNCYWVFASKVYLWPVPDSNTGTLKLFYNRFPDEVTSTNDTPQLDVKYHKTIVDYCLQQAYELDEDWVASQAKANQVTSAVNDSINSEKWTQQNTYPTITVLEHDRW